MIQRTSHDVRSCDHLFTMQNSSPFISSIRNIAFAADSQKDADSDAPEMIRLLLHRLMVLEAALQRVAELHREAAAPPAA